MNAIKTAGKEGGREGGREGGTAGAQHKERMFANACLSLCVYEEDDSNETTL